MGNGESLRFRLRPSRVVTVTAAIALAATVSVTLAIPGNATTSISICSTRNLSGSATLQGESGYQVGTVTLENNGLKPCHLPIRPLATIIRRGLALNIHQIPMPDDQSQSFGGTALAVPVPHAKTAIGLSWHNWCQTLPLKTSSSSGSLVVSLSHSSSPVRINIKNIHPARCDLPGKQSTLAVGRFRSP